MDWRLPADREGRHRHQKKNYLYSFPKSYSFNFEWHLISLNQLSDAMQERQEQKDCSVLKENMQLIWLLKCTYPQDVFLFQAWEPCFTAVSLKEWMSYCLCLSFLTVAVVWCDERSAHCWNWEAVDRSPTTAVMNWRETEAKISFFAKPNCMNWYPD